LNVTQILDLQANRNNEFTSAYADPSGASDLTALISVDGGKSTPGEMKVKYSTAASVAQTGGYTWAGQTFGGNFESAAGCRGRRISRRCNAIRTPRHAP